MVEFLLVVPAIGAARQKRGDSNGDVFASYKQYKPIGIRFVQLIVAVPKRGIDIFPIRESGKVLKSDRIQNTPLQPPQFQQKH